MIILKCCRLYRMSKRDFEKLALKLLIESNVNFTDEQKEVLKYIIDELYKEYLKK